MARVLTNNVVLQYAVESAIGTLPGSPAWRELEPNAINSFGATITTTERRPISKQRGRKKGTVSKVESGVEFDADLTLDSFKDFAEGFVFAEFANKEFNLRSGTGTLPPPVASGTTFTIDAASGTLAGKVQWVTGAQATLVWAKGYALAGNNGLHVLTADLATSGTTLTVGGSSMTAETPPTNATLEVCGMRFAASDLAFTVSGSTATLTSSDVNFTTIGWFPGMLVHFGSPDTDGTVQNGLGTGTDNYGYARITSVAAGTVTFDKLSTTLATDSSNSAAVDIMFGRFLRNVDVDASSTDSEYLERSYQFEATFPDLGGAGTDEYEYAVGNFANELTLNLPLSDKATATWGFVGTDAEPASTTRATNASSAVSPLRTVALNTSSSIASITTDLISSASNVCFKSLTFSIANNVTPEYCLGSAGASYVNTDLFEVTLEGQMLFTTNAITAAVRNNTTVTFQTIVRNEDGAIGIDIPSMTLGGGDREFPVGASVLVNITGQAFNDPSGAVPNVSLGISLFPAVPYV